MAIIAQKLKTIRRLLERATGIEPVSSVWKTDIIAVILRPQTFSLLQRAVIARKYSLIQVNSICVSLDLTNPSLNTTPAYLTIDEVILPEYWDMGKLYRFGVTLFQIRKCFKCFLISQSQSPLSYSFQSNIYAGTLFSQSF